MLVKYDPVTQLWVASAVIDGAPCVVMSKSMLRAMQLVSALLLAPPANELVQGELRICQACKQIWCGAEWCKQHKNVIGVPV